MEGAIATMVKVFMKSSKGKESLGKKDFQNLVTSQFSNILSGTESKEAVSNMGQGLDTDHDGKVGFEEYMKLIGYLASSLSEQRGLDKEEPAQNAASGQVAQCTPDKEEGKPEAKEEAKPEANEEAKAEANAEVKVEAKAEGETQPETAKEEPAAAAAAVLAAAVPAAAVPAAAVPAAAAAVPAAVEVAAAAVEEVVKEVEETVKVEEAVEKVAAAVEEEVEKKTEEATS
ncbi:S100 calcium binding protein U [Embiotoca jacksoni]|uniref:S100 calcium binding protein U n=1 Tax=Embiotoca jacksoni TaxID=100190 RepID=UPI003703A2E3